MSRRLPPEPPSREITPRQLYLNRREFIKNGAFTLGTAAAVGSSLLWLVGNSPPPDQPPQPDAADGSNALDFLASSGRYDTDEERTPLKDVTTYNNFYEFGIEKSDPARNAHQLRTRP